MTTLEEIFAGTKTGAPTLPRSLAVGRAKVLFQEQLDNVLAQLPAGMLAELDAVCEKYTQPDIARPFTAPVDEAELVEPELERGKTYPLEQQS